MTPPAAATGHVPRLDQHKLAAARLWAADRMPYLASALFATTLRAAPDSGSIGVDRGWHVLADPAVVDDTSVADLGALLLHLVAHLVREHADRADRIPDADAVRWNRCADAEINDDLPHPPRLAGTLPSDLGCRAGRLAEEYYDGAQAGPRNWDCGSGADGVPRPGDQPGDGLSPGAAQLLRLGVAGEVQRAGREPGAVPAGWLRWAESLVASRVDWRRELAAVIRRAVAQVSGRVDYSYRRPSRRAQAVAPAIIPTLVRPVPDVAVVCDTSGSMTDDLLARVLEEVEAILARGGLAGSSLRVLAVDTTVHAVRRVNRTAQVVLAGGGGTDMGAGLTAAVGLRPRPSIVIVLTDGYTPWPFRPPRGARVVIGLLTQSGMPVPPTPDWARTVRIEAD